MTMTMTVATAFAFLGCRTKEDPEARVKATIRKALRGANERSTSKVVEDALPSFKGPNGIDLQESKRMLVGYFMGHGWTRAFERELTVGMDGEGTTRAKATLDVILAEGKPVERIEDILPTQATELIFELSLVEQEGEWKFVSASYRRKHPGS